MQQLAENFWNLRGRHKVAGVLDVGTQMSLARRRNGRFLLLDSYNPQGDDREQLLTLTNGGKDIDAIINVHPFHTLHCRALSEILPSARLIGTQRHRHQLPELDWQQGNIENSSAQQEFLEDLEFAMPAGVDLVTSDDNVHAGSVLVRDRASSIVHVDDTLNVLAAPAPLRRLLPESRLRFHPLLGKALQQRPGAADNLEAWARDLARHWQTTRTVCAAHSAVRQLPEGGWSGEVLHALDDIENTLTSHRKRWG